MALNDLITLRKGSDTEWSNINPVLASGEPGFDITNKILKIGDGSSTWLSLSGITITSSQISDLNSSVSGLLPANIVNGSGIENYAVKWSDSDTLTNGILYDNGSNIGIGTSSPAYKLDVVGTGNFSQNLFVNGTAVSVDGHTHSTRSVSASSTSGSLVPNGDTTDLYVAEGLTGNITFAVPSGTPNNGQKLLIRIKDNGSSCSITWTTSTGGYRAIGISLPTTTVTNKTTYVGCIYNSADVFWDAIATVTQS